MYFRNKVILTTLLFALPAFILGKIIWPVHPMNPEPTSLQLPPLIILSLIESISFGLGVTFLLFGYPLVKKAIGADQNLVFLTYLSTGWLMVNWWIHDNWHAANGLNLDGLIAIEYTFHVTLIIAGAILAYSFLKAHKKS